MSEEPIRLVLKVAPHVADRFRRAARVRHMTQGDYLERLMELHDRLRKCADSGKGGMPICDWAFAVLDDLQLQTVNA